METKEKTKAVGPHLAVRVFVGCEAPTHPRILYAPTWAIVHLKEAFVEATVTSLASYTIYEHTYRLHMAHEQTEVRFSLGAARTLPTFLATRTMHLHTVETLNQLRAELGAPRSGGKSHADLVRSLVNFLGYDASPGGARVIRLAEEAFAKRKAKRAVKLLEKKLAGEESADSSDSDGPQGEQPGESEAPMTEAMRICKAVAPREYGFLMGSVECAKALNEEEDLPADMAASAPPSAPSAGSANATAARGREGGPRGGRVARQQSASSASSSDTPPHSPCPEMPAAMPGSPPELRGSAAVLDGDSAQGLAPTGFEESAPEQPAAPAEIPQGAIQALPGRVAAAFRCPPDDILPAPPGCRFRRFTKHYLAVLPSGVFYRGTNSCSRNFGPARSQAMAYAECRAWLDGAVAEGVVLAG